MADQAISNLTLQVQSTYLENENKNYAYTDTLSKSGKYAGLQDLTSDSTDLNYGEIPSTDMGLMILVNRSGTNTITYGSSDGSFELSLLPGEWHKVRPTSGTQWLVKTVTGTAKLEKYFLAE